MSLLKLKYFHLSLKCSLLICSGQLSPTLFSAYRGFKNYAVRLKLFSELYLLYGQKFFPPELHCDQKPQERKSFRQLLSDMPSIKVMFGLQCCSQILFFCCFAEKRPHDRGVSNFIIIKNLSIGLSLKTGYPQVVSQQNILSSSKHEWSQKHKILENFKLRYFYLKTSFHCNLSKFLSLYFSLVHHNSEYKKQQQLRFFASGRKHTKH